MKLTRASVYALHALAHLVERGDNRPLASHEVAQARGIPEKFLLKVLKPLVSAQLLLSMKGPHGGYRLAKPANKITLLEVIEAVDGPVRSAVPLIEGKSTEQLAGRLQTVCDQANQQIRKQLQATTLADLMTMGGKKK